MTKKNISVRRTSKIIYWIATLWLAFGMISTESGQLLKAKDGQGGIDMITHLGYPVSVLTFVNLERDIMYFKPADRKILSLNQ